MENLQVDEIYEMIKHKPEDELLLIQQSDPSDYPEEVLTAVDKVLVDRGIQLDDAGGKDRKDTSSYIRGSLWASTAIIPLILILLFFTNPGRAGFVQYTKQLLILASQGNPISERMVAVVPDSIIDSGVVCRDYHIFTIYQSKYLGEVKVLGILNRFILLAEEEELLESMGDTDELSDAGEPDVYFVNREAAPDHEGYYVYSNSRYGVSIYYPQELNPNRLPVNGDGQAFTSNDGSIGLTVYGSNISSEETLKELYQEAISGIDVDISYKRLEEDYFILSWIEGDKIYYQKTFAGTESQNTFIFCYPEDKAEEFDETVKIMASSFTPGDLEKAH